MTVSGAGIAVVNGFYEEDGKHRGFPKYTKKSVWKGGNRTLCIYRFGTTCWYIGLVAKDETIGANKDDFCCGDDQKSLPIDGWEPEQLRRKHVVSPCN